MRITKYIAIFLVYLNVNAQEIDKSDFQLWEIKLDSLFNNNNFKKLKNFADSLNQNSTYYPNLNYKLGISNLYLGDYSSALNSFQIVEDMNYDYKELPKYLSLTNRYLNRKDIEYSYRDLGFRITELEFEQNIKFQDTSARGKVNYTRFGLGLNINDNFRLKQNFALFNQTNVYPMPVDEIGSAYNDLPEPIKEIEYYVLLSFNFSPEYLFKAGYHLLNVNFAGNNTLNSLYFLSAKKYFNNFDISADLIIGKLNLVNTKQFGVSAKYYPFGNLNFYYGLGLSYLKYPANNKINNFHNLGFRIFDYLWSETSATFGEIKNYSDNSALYVYHSSDPSEYKISQTFLAFISQNWTFQLTYSYEPKKIEYIQKKYLQQSLSGVLKWAL